MFLNYRNDFRGAVILALGQALAGEARWTASAIPTLENALALLDTKHRIPFYAVGVTRDMVASCVTNPVTWSSSATSWPLAPSVSVACARGRAPAPPPATSSLIRITSKGSATSRTAPPWSSTTVSKTRSARATGCASARQSADPALDINHHLGTLPSHAGAAERLRGKRCLECARPKLSKGPGDSWVLHPDPVPSPACVSAMVVSALRMIGVDTAAFSGVSCRMRGLTVATEAGVPENILWMQSGHAQDRAARRYVRLTNPDRLYDTWRAFLL
jgi:hypothetical protein